MSGCASVCVTNWIPSATGSSKVTHTRPSCDEASLSRDTAVQQSSWSNTSVCERSCDGKVLRNSDHSALRQPKLIAAPLHRRTPANLRAALETRLSGEVERWWSEIAAKALLHERRLTLPELPSLQRQTRRQKRRSMMRGIFCVVLQECKAR